jgi:hypothetical protein
MPNACLVADVSTTPCNQDLVQVALLSQSTIPNAMQVTCAAAHSPGASNAPSMESIHFNTRLPKLQGATTAHDVVADPHPVVAQPVAVLQGSLSLPDSTDVPVSPAPTCPTSFKSALAKPLPSLALVSVPIHHQHPHQPASPLGHSIVVI